MTRASAVLLALRGEGLGVFPRNLPLLNDQEIKEMRYVVYFLMIGWCCYLGKDISFTNCFFHQKKKGLNIAFATFFLLEMMQHRSFFFSHAYSL